MAEGNERHVLLEWQSFFANTTSPPEPLQTLLKGETAEGRHFLDNMRKYNSCLQMTSLGLTKKSLSTATCQLLRFKGKLITLSAVFFQWPVKRPSFSRSTSLETQKTRLNDEVRLFQELCSPLSGPFKTCFTKTTIWSAVSSMHLKTMQEESLTLPSILTRYLRGTSPSLQCSCCF